ncbi:Uncharacterised protein [Yersinia enterocolitica]|nr:Uncharacterised protein [Yersinia enterocolitica]
MAAHFLNISLHHVHANATARNIRHLLSGGETRCKNQHPDIFIAHVFVNGHSLRLRFRQDFLPIQTRAIIEHFDANIAALMFR